MPVLHCEDIITAIEEKDSFEQIVKLVAGDFGAVTGDANEPGINGALMKRQSPPPAPGQAMNGFACTMGVEDYDATEAKIISGGGTVALPKHALPGMAWQGYYMDTEGNVFGIHQPDENAK